jgi:hypothetical protein
MSEFELNAFSLSGYLIVHTRDVLPALCCGSLQISAVVSTLKRSLVVDHIVEAVY